MPGAARSVAPLFVAWRNRSLGGFARRGRQRSLSIHSALQHSALRSALQHSALQSGLPVVLFAAVVRSVPPYEMLESHLDRGFRLKPNVPYKIVHVGVGR